MVQFLNVAKLIGIDYGTKRVGVAVSDDSGSVAFPKYALTNDQKLLPALLKLVQEEKAVRVVLGESKKPDGTDNPVMAAIRRLGEHLTKEGIEVAYEPEFYSSVTARNDLGHSFVDAEAAAIILNSYITRTHGA